MGNVGDVASNQLGEKLNIAAAPKALDTVQVARALAALCVVFQHIRFLRCGAFGVDIFFVISGFIVCYVTDNNPHAFLRKRIFRVVPLYWIGTLGIFAVAAIRPDLLNSTTANFGSLVKSLLFIPYVKENGAVFPMLTQGWTLNYEMLFYMLFGISLAVSNRYAKHITAALIIAIVIAGRLFAAGNPVLDFWSGPILLEFILGFLAYSIWNHRLAGVVVRWPTALLIAATLILFAMFVLEHFQIGANVRYVSLGIPATLIVLLLLSVENAFKMPKMFIKVGDASYSLYLFHLYILQFTAKVVHPIDHVSVLGVVIAIFEILLCIVLAMLSFKFIEYPVNKYLRARFVPRGQRKLLQDAKPAAENVP